MDNHSCHLELYVRLRTIANYRLMFSIFFLSQILVLKTPQTRLTFNPVYLFNLVFQN